VKLLDYFDAFMVNTVNLDEPRLDELQAQVESIVAAVGLDEVVGEHLKGHIRTGSWAHRTIIKPVRNKDFDADILLHLEEVEEWDPERYLVETRKAFERNDAYKDLVKENHSRCVRIDFDEDGHIDVVPYIIRGDTGDGEGDESIVNATTNEFEDTNPSGLAERMKEGDRLANGYLRKVIRLMKYLRDYKTTFSIPSIILMTFLGEQIHGWDSDTRYPNLPTALLNVLTDLDTWLALYPTMPQVEDPSCPGVTFNHRWDQDRYENFRSKITLYAGWVKEAYDETDKAKSLTAWQRVFGEDFKAPVAPVTKVAKIAESASLPWKRAVEGEQFIEDTYPWVGGHTAQIIGKVAPMTGSRSGLIRKIRRLHTQRTLEFTVKTDARGPYDVFWKVRNSGDEAVRAGDLRGKIVREERGAVHKETTKYRGQHFIECYIVLNGKIVATDHQTVTIS
jgi:hypothetical protein